MDVRGKVRGHKIERRREMTQHFDQLVRINDQA